MPYQLYLFKAVPQKKILTIPKAVPAEEKTCDIRTKNIGNVKFVRRFRALSFSYEKVMISAHCVPLAAFNNVCDKAAQRYRRPNAIATLIHGRYREVKRPGLYCS